MTPDAATVVVLGGVIGVGRTQQGVVIAREEGDRISAATRQS
jgi:hypothetical protein